jgi:hypothetical protein
MCAIRKHEILLDGVRCHEELAELTWKRTCARTSSKHKLLERFISVRLTKCASLI